MALNNIIIFKKVYIWNDVKISKNVLAKLELNCRLLPKILMKMTNSSKFLVTILNLEILFNFSLQVLRFTQTNKKTVYNTKFTLLERHKI